MSAPTTHRVNKRPVLKIIVDALNDRSGSGSRRALALQDNHYSVGSLLTIMYITETKNLRFSAADNCLHQLFKLHFLQKLIVTYAAEIWN